MKRVGKSEKHKKLKKKQQKHCRNAACQQKRDSEFLIKRHFLTSGTLNISEKNHDAQSLSVWLYLLLRRDQNHHFNLTSKVMTVSEQIFEKHNRKNPEKTQIEL